MCLKLSSLVLLIVISVRLFSQISGDSLKSELSKASSDTEKVEILGKQAYLWLDKNLDSAIICSQMQAGIANESRKPYLISLALSMKGIIYEYQGENNKSLLTHIEAFRLMQKAGNRHGLISVMNGLSIILSIRGDFMMSIRLQKIITKIAEIEKDTIQMGHSQLNMGLDYYNLGDLKQSVRCGLNALSIYEKLNYKSGIADACNNIGMVYEKQRDYENALKYYRRCMAIEKIIGDEFNNAGIVNNLGLVLYYKGEVDSSIFFFRQALAVWEKHKYINGIIQAQGNLGLAFLKKKYFDDAEFYLKKNIELMENAGNKGDLIYGYSNYGLLQYEKEKYNEAIEYFFKSYNIAKELKVDDQRYTALKNISNAYYENNSVKLAWEYRDKADNLKDSLNNSNLVNTIKQVEDNYILEVKNQEYQINSIKKENRHREELNRSQYIKNILIIGVVVVLLVALILFRNYRIKKKLNLKLKAQNTSILQKNEEITAQRDEITAQKEILSKQKEQIERILEDQTSSIRYARQIQQAMLPSLNELGALSDEYFVIFKPRDIVSGDFYWAEKVENNLMILVADCTGHGVPGAVMSMLGITLIKEIVVKNKIVSPDIILNTLRSELIKALHQESGTQRDGMDIALCSVNLDTLELQFSGANNPLYIVKNAASRSPFTVGPTESEANSQQPIANSKLTEVKGDKMPIGMHERMDGFTLHTQQLNKGDSIYMFSDGLADQFGGPSGKKFKYKYLKEIISGNADKPADEQKEIIERSFSEWAYGYEQVDDVTILGVKL